jgi:hypothetical protein
MPPTSVYVFSKHVTVLEDAHGLPRSPSCLIFHFKDGDLWVDLGAGYIGPTQDHLLRVAKKYGVETYFVNTKGKTSMGLQVGKRYYSFYTYGPSLLCVPNAKGKISSYTGLIPKLSLLPLLDLNRALSNLESLCDTVCAQGLRLTNRFRATTLGTLSGPPSLYGACQLCLTSGLHYC